MLKSGYTIAMGRGCRAAGPKDCNGMGTVLGDYATGAPANLGVTGNRAFAVNTIGTVWENISRADHGSDGSCDGCRRWSARRPTDSVAPLTWHVPSLGRAAGRRSSRDPWHKPRALAFAC